jgi:hypothetical protein
VRFGFDVEFIVVLSGKMKEERIRSASGTRMRAVRWLCLLLLFNMATAGFYTNKQIMALYLMIF